MKNIRVQVTRNFFNNLDEIESFLNGVEAHNAFQTLLDDLFEQAIPTLERHPDIGTVFSRRHPSTQETAVMKAELLQRLGAEVSLRELIRGDYIILYARRSETLYLLTIKHHRQLSFDFHGRWDR
jgi:hypothetical protein